MIRKILVSQPAPSSEKSPYFDIEKKFGVKIDFKPLIHVERLSAKEFRAEKVSILDYSAIVFNSHHSIDHFFAMCKDLRITMPEDMKYFFISEKVALYIQKYVQYRKRKVFFAKTGLWSELIALMAKYKKGICHVITPAAIKKIPPTMSNNADTSPIHPPWLPRNASIVYGEIPVLALKSAAY